MTTRLSDVSVTLRIDTSQAERSLDALDERQFQKRQQGRAAAKAPKEYDFGLPSPAEQRASGLTLPGRGQIEETRRIIEHIEREKTAKKSISERLTSIRNRREIEAFNAPRASDFIMSNLRGTVPGLRGPAVQRLLGMANLGGTAALAGGIYAAASTAAKAAPYGAAFLEGALGAAIPSAVTQQLENMRNLFVGFEAEIKALYTGYTKTLQLEAAVARLTGKVTGIPVPGLTSTSQFYQIYQTLDESTDRLNSKFEEFKGKDVARALGGHMRESFKKAMGG